MQDALWNTPEHIGWQIIHAHSDANGSLRKFSKPHQRGSGDDDVKFNSSFRDITDQDEPIGTDYESLKI